MILRHEFDRLSEGDVIVDNNEDRWTCTRVDARYTNKALHLEREDGLTTRVWWVRRSGLQSDEPLDTVLFGAHAYVLSFSLAA